jgi:hypothetical protein
MSRRQDAPASPTELHLLRPIVIAAATDAMKDAIRSADVPRLRRDQNRLQFNLVSAIRRELRRTADEMAEDDLFDWAYRRIS